jgi:hypothetical protein
MGVSEASVWAQQDMDKFINGLDEGPAANKALQIQGSAMLNIGL